MGSSTGRIMYPIYGLENKSHAPNHQPVMVIDLSIWGLLMGLLYPSAPAPPASAPPAIPPYAVGRVRQRALGIDPPLSASVASESRTWRYQKGKSMANIMGI